MEKPSIFSADQSHAEAYRSIRLKGLSTDPGSFIENLEHEYSLPADQWRNDIADPNSIVLLAGEATPPTNPVAVQKISLTRDSRAHLSGLYVDPSARGQGVAREIVETAVTTAREEWGVDTFYTEVLHQNERLIPLFESLGFVASGAKVVGRKRYPKPFGEYTLTKVDPIEKI